jgi:hypothetical protein
MWAYSRKTSSRETAKQRLDPPAIAARNTRRESISINYHGKKVRVGIHDAVLGPLRPPGISTNLARRGRRGGLDEGVNDGLP